MLGSAHAGAAPASWPASGPDMGVTWEPHQVRYPVAPAEVRPVSPFVPDDTAAITGPIEIGPARTAALWVDALAVLRVRRVDAAPAENGGGEITLTRVVGARARTLGQGRAAIAEPALAAGPGVWYIAQPPAHGDVWMLAAQRPMTVIVERPVRHQGGTEWEALRGGILRWIDEDGPVPDIPAFEGGAALQLRLRAERAMGRLLAAAQPGAARRRRAIRAWRKASALVHLAAVGNRWQPYSLHEPLTDTLAETLPEMSTKTSGARASGDVAVTDLGHARDGAVVLHGDRPYARIDSDRVSWTLPIAGPGAVELDVRALLGDAGRHETRTVEVRAAGRLLVQHTYHSRQAHVRRPDSSPAAAFPRRVELITPDRVPVGLRDRLRVPLLGGEHDYTIEIRGGASLVRARVVRRRPRLREYLLGHATAADWIAAGERALDGDTAPAGALLGGLLGELRGAPARPVPASLPPVLLVAAEVAHLRGRPAKRTPARVRALIARAWLALDRLPDDVDPALGWVLRRDLAEVAARSRIPDAIVPLAERGAELPAVLLAEVASLRIDVDRARDVFPWAIATAQRAWERAPLDAAVHDFYRRIWRWHGEWSRLRAVTSAGGPSRPSPYLYLKIPPVPAGAPAEDPDGPPVLEEGELWRVPGGVRQRILAPPSPIDSRRPVLLQAYVRTPAPAGGTIALRVDDRVFHAVPLAAMEPFTVAVAPGVHDVRIDGPPGTAAFLSLGPAKRPITGMQRARLRHIRPTPSGTHPTYHNIPPAYRGVPLRITLRAVVPASAGHETIRVELRTDTGPARTIVLDAGITEPALVPVDGVPRLTARVRTVIWVPSDATRLWLETEPGVEILARVAIRTRRDRGPAGAREQPPATPPDAAAMATRDRAASDDDLTGDDTSQADMLDGSWDDSRVWRHGDPRWDEIADRITGVSRDLAATPDDPMLLLRRAHLLLDIGQAGHARADLERLGALDTAQLTPSQVRARGALERRIDAWRDERYLPLQPRPLPGAIAIAPGSLALADEEGDVRPWAEVAQAVRRTGDRDLLYQAAQEDDSWLGRYFRADMLRRQGEHRQAADALRELYEDTGRPQIGMEALLAFERSLAGGFVAGSAANEPPGDVSLAYGLALGVRAQLEHPAVERVLYATARQSRWETIRNTDANAGFERMYLDQSESEPGPITQVKRSLLAAPWPLGDAHVVEPGRGALLSVDLAAPAVIRPQVWCQRIRPSGGAPAPACAVRWRVDNQTARAESVALREETTLGAAPLGPGRHQLEVALDHGDDSLLLAVRFVANRPLRGGTDAARETAIPVRRPGRVYVADADRPVQITVLGPTTLRVEARRYDEQPPVMVEVVAVPEAALEHGPEHGLERGYQRTLRVDGPRDEAASSDGERAVQLSVPTIAAIPLPGRTPYRVSVRPRSGQALVRFGRREDLAPPDMAGSDQPAAPAMDRPAAPASLAAVDARPWPGQPLAMEGLAGRLRRQRQEPLWPMLSAGVAFRRDDLDERDALNAPLENRIQADLAWRRELVQDELWLRVKPAMRWHPGTSPAYGGFFDVDWRRLPYRLGLDLSTRWFTQSVEGVSGWSAYGQVRVSRFFRLHPSLTLMPALSLHARHYSLDATKVAAEVFDPLVYSDYGRGHRYGLRPRARLYWRAFQDQIGFATAQIMTNESMATIDHAVLGIGWRGIIESRALREPIFEVEYQPNLRLRDEYRSESYLRHDIDLGLEWSMWRGRGGRLVFELRNRLYLSNLLGNRNVFSVGVRYDVTHGRGLRDVLPSERRFTDFIEHRQWAD